MPRIADYMAHSGSAKILTTGDIDVDFVFGGIGTGGIGSGCVATFMVNTEGSNDLKVQCKLGGQIRSRHLVLRTERHELDPTFPASLQRPHCCWS